MIVMLTSSNRPPTTHTENRLNKIVEFFKISWPSTLYPSLLLGENGSTEIGPSK